MKAILSELSEISLGTILTRVKPKSEYQPFKCISTIGMQELSYNCGKDDTKYDEIVSKVESGKIDKCLLTKELDVVIGLSSQNAMVISKNRANSLLPSNFCLVRIYDRNILDPYYFTWLFNENSTIKRQLTDTSQGQAYVKMISLEVIRNLEIDLPPIRKQYLIGQIYSLSVQKKHCERRLINLKEKVLNRRLEKMI